MKQNQVVSKVSYLIVQTRSIRHNLLTLSLYISFNEDYFCFIFDVFFFTSHGSKQTSEKS